jgi:hypothetical protein
VINAVPIGLVEDVVKTFTVYCERLAPVPVPGVVTLNPTSEILEFAVIPEANNCAAVTNCCVLFPQ